MSGDQKRKLELWGGRIGITLGLATIVTMLISAGAWAEEQKQFKESTDIRIKSVEEKIGERAVNERIMNNNIIRMAVKAGVPRSELEDLK